MGNDQSNDNNSQDTIDIFLQYYQQVHQVQSNLYGDVMTYKDTQQQGKFVCLSKRIFHDEEEQIQYEKQIEQCQQLKHESLVKLLCVGKNKQDEFCSQFYQISYIHEYIEYNLGSDIFQRQANGMAFYDENELWITILTTIAGLCYLNDQNITWLDIKPSNILINSESKYQLLPRPPFSNQINSYQECILRQNPECLKYLSPVLLENLRDKQPNPIHDPVKTDIFTLGISIIEAALLKSITQDLYDWENLTINLEVLENALNTMSLKYSQNLMVFVGSMVQLDEVERPGCQQLFDELERLLSTKNPIEESSTFQMGEDARFQPFENQEPHEHHESEDQMPEVHHDDDEVIKRHGHQMKHDHEPNVQQHEPYVQQQEPFVQKHEPYVQYHEPYVEQIQPVETKKYVPTSTIKFVEKRKNPADTTTTYVKKVIPSIHENREPKESEYIPKIQYKSKFFNNKPIIFVDKNKKYETFNANTTYVPRKYQAKENQGEEVHVPIAPRTNFGTTKFVSKYDSSVKNSNQIVPTKFVVPKSDQYNLSSYTRKFIPKNYLDEEKENA